MRKCFLLITGIPRKEALVRDNEDIEDRDISPELMERIPTLEEVRHIRTLIEDHKRNKWLFANIKAWSVAIFSIIVFFTSGSFDAIRQALKKVLL
jgi:hypothetical protein